MRFDKSKKLQQKSHLLIPGGAHTYAKGDDQYPVQAPGFIARGEGCHVWDVDGNEFIEYGMGLRAVTLGHAYKSVVEAAHRQMLLGANFTRPSPIEVECAEALLGIIPGAEMVKFAKNGSDVNTAAVKLARAFTGRDMIAICGDQPFFAVDDWFIGTTEVNAGIPQVIQDLTVKFRYNDIENLRQLFERYPKRIACVILEPATSEEPVGEYLGHVKRTCEDFGAVLIFDEMITGFRWHLGGAQTYYGVTPHLSTFGKALGNGFAVSALVGDRRLMNLGGLEHDRERVFLLSTTHGAETHALAAAMEVMRIYREQGVIEFLRRQGARLRTQINKSIAENNLEGHFEVVGLPCNLIFVTKDAHGKRSQAYRTLFLQELIRRGVLAPSFVVSFSHTDEDIDRTAAVVHEALGVYRKALANGVAVYLEGRSVKPVNRRHN